MATYNIDLSRKGDWEFLLTEVFSNDDTIMLRGRVKTEPPSNIHVYVVGEFAPLDFKGIPIFTPYIPGVISRPIP